MARPPKYRFHLDENFPAWTGKFLAALGHNVAYAQTIDRGRLSGSSDYHQLRFARKDRRIFLTYDRDFHQHHLARLIEQSQGVITIRGDLTKALLKRILSRISPSALRGKLCHASVDSIRVVKPRV